jgi:hypothetical protein
MMQIFNVLKYIYNHPFNAENKVGGIFRFFKWQINCLLNPYLIQLNLDNNAIENKISPLSLGRKNFLFAGSHEGAKRIAMTYFFFASCNETNVNPSAKMKYTLNRIGNHPVNKLSELLTSNFQI